MNLNTIKWQDFDLCKLFDVEAGIYHYSDEYSDGNTPYCSASAENNGISKRIDLSPDFTGNKIITGKVGCTAFYVPCSFCATSDVNILTPKFEMTPYIAFFIITIINKNENYRWNYGRQCRVGNTKNIRIKLPIKYTELGTPSIDETKTYSKNGYVPDWDFMEQYIKSLYSKPITSTIKSSSMPNVDTIKWKKFIIKNLFEVCLSKGDIKADDMAMGTVPLVSSGETNNGIVAYIDRVGDGKAEIFDGNILTVDMFCNSFYQREDFYAVSHGRINILIPKFNMNQYIGLFISAIINKEKYKYSYGRAVYSNVVANMEIKLPIQRLNDQPIIDETCEFSDEGYLPDWEWMENYIKSLPYSDRI